MNQNQILLMNSANPLKRIAYNFVQINDDETEIEIYDVISSRKSHDWWTGEEGKEVTPSDFKEQLDAVNTPNVTIRMNSGGGEVFAANTISVAIQEAIQRGKNIVCKIDGVCASAAVQIATSCKEVIIHKGALMMIHNPMSGLCGYYDAIELGKIINMLTGTKDAIINHYADKTGLSRQKLSNMMDAETWLDGTEAVKKGFADKLMFDDVQDDAVLNNIKTACAGASWNLPENYQTAINAVTTNIQEKGEPEMEIKTIQDLQAKYPDLVNELRANVRNEVEEQARQAGAESERERMKAIDEMQGKVSNEALNKAKYETFDTAEKVALDAIKNNAFVQAGVVNAIIDETKPANQVNGSVTPAVEEPKDANKQTAESAAEIAKNYLKSLGKVE